MKLFCEKLVFLLNTKSASNLEVVQPKFKTCGRGIHQVTLGSWILDCGKEFIRRTESCSTIGDGSFKDVHFVPKKANESNSMIFFMKSSDKFRSINMRLSLLSPDWLIF